MSVYPVAGIASGQSRSFIGFKHINGPAKWDAYAKARYAAQWYESGRTQGHFIDLAVIANAIGDKHDTIKRMVSAIYVLDQAKDEGLFDIENRHTTKLNFSCISTRLFRGPSTWTTWVSGRHGHVTIPSRDQVPRTSRGEATSIELRQGHHLVWIYVLEEGQGAIGRAIVIPRS